MSEFKLNGIIASDDDKPIYDWFGIAAVSPGAVRGAIDAAKSTDGVLDVLINSPGGSVFAGAEMYSMLRAVQGVKVRCIVQSVAASAASCILCAGEENLISPMGQVMVHLPMTSTDGNRNDHRDSIRMLDSVTTSILNAYELRCQGKKTRAELRRMTEAETWLSAQEAIDAGFCDRLTGETDGVLLAPQAVACAMPFAADGLNLSEMRRAYLAAQQTPPDTPPVSNLDAAQARARLIAIAEADLHIINNRYR